jgi:hypothetical protein
MAVTLFKFMAMRFLVADYADYADFNAVCKEKNQR